jgi:hypothetical protein
MAVRVLLIRVRVLAGTAPAAPLRHRAAAAAVTPRASWPRTQGSAALQRAPRGLPPFLRSAASPAPRAQPVPTSHRNQQHTPTPHITHHTPHITPQPATVAHHTPTSNTPQAAPHRPQPRPSPSRAPRPPAPRASAAPARPTTAAAALRLASRRRRSAAASRGRPSASARPHRKSTSCGSDSDIAMYDDDILHSGSTDHSSPSQHKPSGQTWLWCHSLAGRFGAVAGMSSGRFKGHP